MADIPLHIASENDCFSFFLIVFISILRRVLDSDAYHKTLVSLLPSFLPSFLPSVLPSFLPSFLPPSFFHLFSPACFQVRRWMAQESTSWDWCSLARNRNWICQEQTPQRLVQKDFRRVSWNQTEGLFRVEAIITIWNHDLVIMIMYLCSHTHNF